MLLARPWIVALTLGFCAGLPALAAAGGAPLVANLPLSPGQMLMEVFGGLALFLFGLDLLGEGLKAAAGARLKACLARFTANRFSAALTGAGVTAVIQSSSVTTVLAVGFVASGVMTLNQSVGVIMGANVGTTVTAQILAFKVEDLALGFIAAGFLMGFAATRETIQSLGRVVMGRGLVFFGMALMSSGMQPLRTYGPFIELMTGMDAPWSAS